MERGVKYSFEDCLAQLQSKTYQSIISNVIITGNNSRIKAFVSLWNLASMAKGFMQNCGIGLGLNPDHEHVGGVGPDPGCVNVNGVEAKERFMKSDFSKYLESCFVIPLVNEGGLKSKRVRSLMTSCTSSPPVTLLCTHMHTVVT